MLKLENLKKVYDGVTILENINLDIEDGEIVSILGPSGCGKTTLLNLILGIADADGGRIIFNGEDITNVPMEKRGFNIVFQDYALFPNLNVYENITYGLRNKPDISSKEEVQELIELLGLTEHLNKRIDQLSGGQKQRVAIGSAIMREPKAFLMDEPLSNLDAKLRAQMRVELSELHKRLGATMIYVTHDQTEAMTLGTRIVVMKDGYIQQADTPREVYDNPANRFVAGFIGSPSMNFFEGKIRPTDKGADFEFTNGLRLEIPENKAFALANEYRNKNVILGVRPEHFFAEVVQKDPKADYTKRTLSGKIVAREMLGAESMFYLEETFAGEFAVRLPVETKGRVGEEMALFVDMDRVHFFDADTEKNIFYRGGQQ